VTEILYFFVGEYSKDQKVNEGGGVDDEENIEVMEIPFTKALEMIRSGDIRDAKTIMLLQYAQLHQIL
jgi:GDP-mannose pyrophosphatase NudK